MKALILAAGKGTRFASSRDAHFGRTQEPAHKCLTQIGHRRVADFSLDTAVDLGVDELVLVVGYLAETIQAVYGDSYRGVPITYTYQREQRGLAQRTSGFFWAMKCWLTPIIRPCKRLFTTKRHF